MTAPTNVQVKGNDNSTPNVPIYAPGRQAAADSKPVALSAEDKASLDTLANQFTPQLSAVWNGNSIALSAFDEAQVQVVGLGGGDTIVIQSSLDGATGWGVHAGSNMASFAIITSITADGRYSFPGTGFIRLVKTGGNSTPVYTLLRR